MKRIWIIAALCLVQSAYAQQGGPDQQRERRGGGMGMMGGAMREALEAACKDHKAGDTVEVKRPNGDTVKATCKLMAVIEPPPRPAQ
jgi:hypothetical protein